MQNILIIYYFAISQKFSKIVFENENLAIFVGNSQKFSCPPPPPLNNEPITICLYLGIRNKFDRFWPIIWSIFLNETNLIYKVRLNYIFFVSYSSISVEIIM